jgi:hypothetical protein
VTATDMPAGRAALPVDPASVIAVDEQAALVAVV